MDKFIDQKVNPNRLPVEIFWDLSDPRLLAVETEYAKQETPQDLNEAVADVKPGHSDEEVKKKIVEEFTDKTLETFFVTTDYGCKR
jgi:hypothetical protein